MEGNIKLPKDSCFKQDEGTKHWSDNFLSRQIIKLTQVQRILISAVLKVIKKKTFSKI
jgi:hypothetical protein